MLLRRVLSDDLEVVDARCERNVHVTQVLDAAMPRNSLLGRDKRGAPLNATSVEKAERLQEEVTATVNGLAAKHGDKGDFFAIANLPVEVALKPRLAPNVLTGHFAGVRGSNAYEHCAAGANIGREQASPLAVEDMARALFSDDPEPLNLTGGYVKETRGIRMRDGSAVPVEVWVHPDPRVQALLELVRERELEQGMDRLRLIHNTETKHWYNMCNVPLDVTVDRVITRAQLLHEATGRMDNGRQGKGRRFYGSRLKEAVRRGNGVLPLSAAELVRLHGGEGGLWGSETAAKRDLENRHTRQIDLFTECAPFPPVEVEYRRPSQRARASRALVAAPRHDRDAIRTKLVALVGEIALLEIAPLDGQDADPRPAAPPERAGGRSPAIVALEPNHPVPQADAGAEAPSLAPPDPPLPPELVARIRCVAGRLAALPPPPRMWNDFTDPVRLWGWHDRVAAVVAARDAAVREAEIARRVALYDAASAAALEALGEPDAALAAERALLGTAAFRPRPGEAPPWGVGAAISAEAVM